MKLMIIKIMMILSTIMMMLKSPISMGFNLVLQTIFMTMFLSKIMLTSWMAMISFLMMVGALMILFMYMSSIASNEKFKPNMKLYSLLLLFLLPMEELMMETQIIEEQEKFKLESLNMIKFYNKKTAMITTIMFIYLFITMIIVTKLTKLEKGPLRMKTYE